MTTIQEILAVMNENGILKTNAKSATDLFALCNEQYKYKGKTQIGPFTTSLIQNQYKNLKDDVDKLHTWGFRNFKFSGNKVLKRTEKQQSGNKILYYLEDLNDDNAITYQDSLFDLVGEEVNYGEIEKHDFQKLSEDELHPLITEILFNTDNIYCKTIQATAHSGVWTNPDIIGVKSFKNAYTDTTSKLIQSIDIHRIADLYSFELKVDILNESDLKKYFFQAASNSSWSNYGYLVFKNFNENLFPILSRLSSSFGIGAIQIIESNIEGLKYSLLKHFESSYRELDYRTIDHMCKNNKVVKGVLEFYYKVISDKKNQYDISAFRWDFKPVAKRVAKSAAKKVAKPVAKKVAKPAAKKGAKSAAKKVAKPAAQKGAKSK
jgi:hypothetical protein